VLFSGYNPRNPRFGSKKLIPILYEAALNINRTYGRALLVVLILNLSPKNTIYSGIG